MTETIHKLNNLYQYVTTHPSCDFYRNFYGPNRPEAITCMKDWQSLPILTKEYIGTIPYAERLFTPNADVRAVRITSGTSGSRPIVFPRNCLHIYTNYLQWIGSSRGIIQFYNAQSYMYEAFADIQNGPPCILTGDNTQPHLSMKAAFTTEIDTIFSLLSTLKIIRTQLNESEALQIKNIICGGEILTEYDKDALLKTFPNARILMTYTLTESQGDVGYMEISSSQPATSYIPGSDFYIEAHPNTDELLISHHVYEQNPFPFLKYNTGDNVTVTRNRDNSIRSFEVLGRSALDTVKIPGGQLQTSEIEKSLRHAHPHFTGDFRAFYRIISDGRLELTLRIHSTNTEEPVIQATSLSRHIASLLRVRSDYSYADGVIAGSYTPLRCEIVQSFPESTDKIIRIRKKAAD